MKLREHKDIAIPMTKKHSELGDNNGLCERCNREETRHQCQQAMPVYLGGGLGWGTMWCCAQCIAESKLKMTQNSQKITPSMIEELKDPTTLTIARQSEIISIIDEKVDEIWRFICKTAKANMRWYSYSTDKMAFSLNGNGSDGGTFDPIKYEEFIYLVGEWNRTNLYMFEDGFPTKLLYVDDYKQEVLAAFSAAELFVTIRKRKNFDKKKKELLDKLSEFSVKDLQSLVEKAFSTKQ